MTVLSAGLAAILLSLFGIVIWNMFVLRRGGGSRITDDTLPPVSILVPARNEEANIRACIESLLRQDYPGFELHVLDDNSTDGTASILREMAEGGTRFTVHAGAEPPAGWVGKNYACHQLSLQARGDWLLFTDADTVHEPHSVREAMQRALAERADLLTLIPRQIMTTAAEKLVIPLLHFVSMTLLPLFLVHHTRNSKFAIGVGQFMLFRRETYERIGGHSCVKSEIVEDIRLAKIVKAAGGRLRVMSGVELVSCRMYRSMGDIWNGFTKNIFAGFGFSFPLMAAVLAMLFVLFVLPFLLLAAALPDAAANPLPAALAGAQVALIWIIRLTLSARFRLGFWSSLLHPLGILAVIAIALNSWLRISFGPGAGWKGRFYRMEMLSGKKQGSEDS
jgi:chlorobactene glucosyltransferase